MPLHAGAHSQIGRYLCEAGRVDEGMRRIDLALRLDPNDVAPRMFRASTLALLGDKAGAYAVLDEIRRRSGPMSALILETRFAVWFDDRELAARSAELIRSHATGAAWERAGPVMEAIATHTPLPDAARVLKAVTLDPMPPRHQALMFAIASEYYARMDLLDEALATLEQTVLLPTTDLLWLDRCEALAPIRAAPRFAAARAVVAARVAELWS
jgi:serine/threonine-protein kinase